MKTALIVNCSAPHYNLGAHKLRDYLREQGYAVTLFSAPAQRYADPGLFSAGYDLVALSVIFSWHAPLAREIAWRTKDQAEVWCGGPGLFALGNWWRQETGLEAMKGLDARFERQRGPYRMTFASRGCPVGCSFCLVPRLEGTTFTLDPDFIPAPILCDNNLSALPVEFQHHIIRRYQETHTRLLDANSGFEPARFDEDTYQRWKPLLRGPWRFALDEQRDLEPVTRMLRILKEERPRRKRVYVLLGNEPLAACYERAMKVIEGGGEPFCQYILPLNWLGDPRTLRPRFDWTYQRGKDVCRFFNRFLWRSLSLRDYRPRKNEPPPFQTLLPARCSSTSTARVGVGDRACPPSPLPPPVLHERTGGRS